MITSEGYSNTSEGYWNSYEEGQEYSNDYEGRVL